jgi:hypothetical protein
MAFFVFRDTYSQLANRRYGLPRLAASITNSFATKVIADKVGSDFPDNEMANDIAEHIFLACWCRE